jgi:hypothetical protein
MTEETGRSPGSWVKLAAAIAVIAVLLGAVLSLALDDDDDPREGRKDWVRQANQLCAQLSRTSGSSASTATSFAGSRDDFEGAAAAWRRVAAAIAVLDATAEDQAAVDDMVDSMKDFAVAADSLGRALEGATTPGAHREPALQRLAARVAYAGSRFEARAQKVGAQRCAHGCGLA